jgi:CheY-like chemotaxis protein
MATSDMLAELGHVVLEAGTGREALDMLAKEVVDILITDLGLPGMSGEELARQVRRDYPGMFIIFATGESEMPHLDGDRKGLLKKPYSREDVERLIRTAAFS